MNDLASGPLVRQVGLALYGTRWESALARDLSVSTRALRYWVSGRAEPPAGVWCEMLKLLRSRAENNGRVALALVSKIGVAYALADS